MLQVNEIGKSLNILKLKEKEPLLLKSEQENNSK